MNEQELKLAQDAIVARLTVDDPPAPTGIWGGNQEVLNLLNLSANTTCIIYSGVMSHEHAAEVIARLNKFYDNVTPDELAILNKEVMRCDYCHRRLTDDEYPEVTTRLDRAGLLFKETRRGQRFNHLCNDCIHTAPIETTSNRQRPGYAYLAYWHEEDLYKIGMSVDANKRMKVLDREYPGIKLVHTIPATDMWIAEIQLISRFLHCHIRNELFDLTVPDIGFILSLGGTK